MYKPVKSFYTIISCLFVATLGCLCNPSRGTNLKDFIPEQQRGPKKWFEEKNPEKASPKLNPTHILDIQADKALNEIRLLVEKHDFIQAKIDLRNFFENYNNTRAALRARRLHQELSLVGMDVPQNWGIVLWIQGENDIDLNSTSTMLVVFWEEWCGYCRMEVPKIQRLYADYKDKGLNIVGLTRMERGTSQEKFNAFIKSNNIQFPNAKENGSATAYFQVDGVPAAALVHDGKIVWRGHPIKIPIDFIRKYLHIQE